MMTSNHVLEWGRIALDLLQLSLTTAVLKALHIYFTHTVTFHLYPSSGFTSQL